MNKALAQCLIILGTCYNTAVMAREPSTCTWPTAPGMKDFQRNIGTLYIPRDAGTGTVIGSVDMSTSTRDPSGQTIQCWNSADALLEFDARPTAPIFPGQLPPINGEDVTGKIVQTNIPGVGVRIKLGFPFNGISPNSFHPVGGLTTVPFRAVNDHVMLNTPILFTHLRNIITLVKTGPIPAGPNQLNGSELFSGYMSDLGTVMRYRLSGTIIQAQCTVGGNPVSADPVQLGEWDSADFTGPGYTTALVPFNITLSNCETDTSGAVVATANIQLDGVKGSVPVGPNSSGVLSLTSDSDAQGVGIQVLKADGVTPMELATQVPLIAITPGNTVLNFNARFYQTGASNMIRPGLAKGALSFTLSYK